MLSRTTLSLLSVVAVGATTTIAAAQAPSDLHGPKGIIPIGPPSSTWITVYGGDRADRIEDAVAAPRGGTFFAGTSSSFDAAELSVWVGRVNRRGVPLWERTFSGDRSTSYGALLATPDGGCLVAAAMACGETGTGAWLAKLSGDGHVQWQRCFRGPGGETFTALATSPRGYFVGGAVHQTVGLRDACVLEINRQGDVLWQKRLGGGLEDVVQSLTTTTDGVLVNINSTSSLPGQPHDSERALRSTLARATRRRRQHALATHLQLQRWRLLERHRSRVGGRLHRDRRDRGQWLLPR